MCEKDYIWNPKSENGKYLGSIIDHSVIMCELLLNCFNKNCSNNDYSNKF